MTNEQYNGLTDEEYTTLQSIKSFGISQNKANRDTFNKSLESLDLGIEYI